MPVFRGRTFSPEDTRAMFLHLQRLQPLKLTLYGARDGAHVRCGACPAALPSPCLELRTLWALSAAAEMQPLKLSLCGATALTHDAVSALLRLPVLTELDIGGCCRIIAMDKMRLVAKVGQDRRIRWGRWLPRCKQAGGKGGRA